MTAPAVLMDRQTFLTALQGSGLLTAAQLSKAIASLPANIQDSTLAAQHLVTSGVLTRFQAERLLAGRTDGFILGQYLILEQIGRGAMGRVFKAKHRTMNRFVAIKVLRQELTQTPTAREGFQREVRTAARLNHPNIVTAYDANEIGERFYLVLEFVDGPNLERLIRERGPLPVAEACEIIRQAACGLQHAHEQGMVHRDVKPANMLAARPSRACPGCVVKIADFGIARIAPGLSTSSAVGQNGLLGTPDYVAPEQAVDPRTADHRADLYSLGCVFYFLLTGQPPFPGGTSEDKVRRHLHERPVPIERIRPDLPSALVDVVTRLLAKDPNSRFQSAATVASRLDGYAATSVAIGDCSGLVSFQLPAPHPGVDSFAQGGLTGLHPVEAETSPWAQLTEDPSQKLSAVIIDHELTITPHETRITRRSATGRYYFWSVIGITILLAMIGMLVTKL